VFVKFFFSFEKTTQKEKEQKKTFRFLSSSYYQEAHNLVFGFAKTVKHVKGVGV
jgi:hypothetical protein